MAAFAEASIANVLVRQQWPWSAEVYIDYDVVGVEGAAPQDVVVTAYDGEMLLGELPRAALSGSRYSIAKDGRYRITFDPAKAGSVVNGSLSKFNVALSLVASTAESEILYKIVDLASGHVTDISRADLLEGRYGAVETNFDFVGSTSLDNVLIWTGVTNNIAYKTTKMVFRKIPAGSFTMGSPTTEGGRTGAREAEHPVTLTRDFYLSVFKLTQAQWLQFMDKPPYPFWESWHADQFDFYTNSAYRVCAARHVTYASMRGDYSKEPDAGDWPRTGNRVSAASFLGQMRARVPVDGFEFDLPTEAQWEYACRAGTTGPLYDGRSDSWNVRKTRLLYTIKTEVGLRLPNAFGLYDLLAPGSCGEVVLDYSAENYGSPTGAAVTDPHGGSREEFYWENGTNPWPRVLRGSSERVARRNFIKEFEGNPDYGCRIALQPDGWWVNAADTGDASAAASDGRSNVAYICLDTRENPYWRTALAPAEPGSIALEWPRNATRATLTLTMGGVSRTHEITDTTATSYALPAFDVLADAAGERVCELTLAYDSGQTLQATLGVVQGVGVRGRTPLIASAENGKWRKAPKACVLPIPAGTTQLTVNGAELPVAALGGDAGWLAWAFPMGESTLTRVEGDAADSVILNRFPDGGLIIIR